MNLQTDSFIAFLLLVSLVLGGVYLVFVGLAAILLWVFALSYNPWLLGLGLWTVVLIGRAIFRR